MAGFQLGVASKKSEGGTEKVVLTPICFGPISGSAGRSMIFCGSS